MRGSNRLAIYNISRNLSQAICYVIRVLHNLLDTS